MAYSPMPICRIEQDGSTRTSIGSCPSRNLSNGQMEIDFLIPCLLSEILRWSCKSRGARGEGRRGLDDGDDYHFLHGLHISASIRITLQYDASRTITFLHHTS